MNQGEKSLNDILKFLGCSSEEKSIFWKIFKSEGIKVSEIAKSTKISRVRCYYYISLLEEKGLVYTDLGTKVNVYHSFPVDEIVKIVEYKSNDYLNLINKLKDSKALLETLRTDTFLQTRVKIHPSHSGGVMNAYRELKDEVEFCSIYNANYLKKINPQIFDEFMNQAMQKRVKLRELIVNADETLKEQFLNNKQSFYEVKFIELDETFFSHIAIFKDKLTITSFNADYTIEITDLEMTKSLQSLFNFLWGLSK